MRVEWIPTRLNGPIPEDEDWESAEDANQLVVIDRYPGISPLLFSTNFLNPHTALLHGDIVAFASNPYGQTGTVIDVDLEVDLEFSTSEHRKSISSQHVK